VGASNNDPELLTRLLRQSLYLPDKSDVLVEGKKVVPAEVLASAYKKFLDRDNPPPISVTSKGGKNKGKGKYGAPNSNQRSRWPPPKAEVTGFDFLMLPHPKVVNRDEEPYVVQGPLTFKTRVTKENWDTLRFNTKTMGPEYFPSSYLSPVPTLLSESGDVNEATFPRSTITGTVENFRTLLLAYFCPRITGSPRTCIGL
jgi:hypothetical protein